MLGLSVPKTWRKIPWYCEWYSFCIPGHLYGLTGMCEANWVLIRGCDPSCWILHWPGAASFSCLILQGFALALGLTSHTPAILLYIRRIRSLVFLLLRSHTPLDQPLCYCWSHFFFSDMQTFSSILPLSILQWFPTVLTVHPIFLLEGTWPFVIYFLHTSPVLPSLRLLALVLGGISALYTC